MRRDTDPLWVARTERSDGLVVARQAPPASAASFSATYLAPAGFGYDPPDLRGLALLTSQLVTSGAGPRDRVTLARDLDRLGATLHTRCHPESTEVTIWGPSDADSALMAILADVVLRPRFEGSDLDRVRRQMFERQLREMAQPESRAEKELLRAVFPLGHRYRETGSGTRRSVTKVRRGDLVRFHRAHFTASGSFVVVTAPASLSEVRAEVDRRFQDFDRESAPLVGALPTIRPPAAPRHDLEMPGRSQVEILIGGSSIARSAPEYLGAYLANEVLGGRPLLSRLFQRVRESEGLAYHASSDFEAMRWGGTWTAQAGTGPERARKVVPILIAELERIRSEPIPSRELHTIRESTIGELPLSLETTSGAHDLAVESAYFGLAPDYFQRLPDLLRCLTSGDVRHSAEIAFDRRFACTVVAGPKSIPRRST